MFVQLSLNAVTLILGPRRPENISPIEWLTVCVFFPKVSVHGSVCPAERGCGLQDVFCSRQVLRGGAEGAVREPPLPLQRHPFQCVAVLRERALPQFGCAQRAVPGGAEAPAQVLPGAEHFPRHQPQHHGVPAQPRRPQRL